MAAIEHLDDGSRIPHEQRIRQRRAVGTDQNMGSLGHAELLAEGEEVGRGVDLQSPSGMSCGQERLELSY